MPQGEDDYCNSVTFANTVATSGTLAVNGTLTVAGDVNLTGTITLGPTATISGTGTLTCGTVTVAGAIGASATSTTTLVSSVAALTTTGALSINANTNKPGSTAFLANATFNQQDGTVSLGGALTTAGNANKSAGVATYSMTVGNPTLIMTLANNYALNNSGGAFVFTLSKGTIIYQGSVGKVRCPTTYNNLTLDNSAGFVLNSTTTSATVKGMLALVNGVFNDVLSAGVLIMNSGSTMVRGAGSITVSPELTNSWNVTYTNSVSSGPELPYTPATNLNNLTVLGNNVTVTLTNAPPINGALVFNYGYMGGANPAVAALDAGTTNNLTGTNGGNVIINVSGSGLALGTIPLIANTPQSASAFTLGTLPPGWLPI